MLSMQRHYVAGVDRCRSLSSSMFLVENSLSVELFSSATRASAKCCLAFRRQRYAIGIVAGLQIIFFLMLVHEHVTRYATTERCSCVDGDRWNADSDDTPPLIDEMDMMWIGLMSMLKDADCTETFLRQYEKFCETALVPAGVGYRSDGLSARRTEQSGCRRQRQQRQQQLDLCPCVPRQRLIGLRNPLFLVAGNTSSSANHYGVDQGGHWSPSECVARQRIAIIIPFRDRDAHLEKLLQVLHPMLQRQLVAYSIFVVEQFQPTDIFNKASVMNAGFLEVRALDAAGSSKSGVTVGEFGGPFDCYVFHDVDMLPEDDRNFYGCGVRLPRHVGAYLNKYNYRLLYYNIFGGVTSFRPEVFELVNGFSNDFYGWGGEDDDMFNRIVAKNLTFVRFPKCVSKYTMIKHARDKTNKENRRRVVGHQTRTRVYERDGLNNLRHKLVSAELRPLYTRLLISLPPAPPKPRSSRTK